MKQRPYIGYNAGTMVVFSSNQLPTKESHQQFGAVIGPFRTKRSAKFMKETSPNPHCQCVADAERLSER